MRTLIEGASVRSIWHLKLIPNPDTSHPKMVQTTSKKALNLALPPKNTSHQHLRMASSASQSPMCGRRICQSSAPPARSFTMNYKLWPHASCHFSLSPLASQRRSSTTTSPTPSAPCVSCTTLPFLLFGSKS